MIGGLTCVEIFFGSLAIHEEGGADFVPGVSQVWPLDSISFCTLLKNSWQINDPTLGKKLFYFVPSSNYLLSVSDRSSKGLFIS